MIPEELASVGLPADLASVLQRAQKLHIAGSVDELFDLATGERTCDYYEVSYRLPD